MFPSNMNVFVQCITNDFFKALKPADEIFSNAGFLKNDVKNAHSFNTMLHSTTVVEP